MHRGDKKQSHSPPGDPVRDILHSHAYRPYFSSTDNFPLSPTLQEPRLQFAGCSKRQRSLLPPALHGRLVKSCLHGKATFLFFFSYFTVKQSLDLILNQSHPREDTSMFQRHLATCRRNSPQHLEHEIQRRKKVSLKVHKPLATKPNV